MTTQRKVLHVCEIQQENDRLRGELERVTRQLAQSDATLEIYTPMILKLRKERDEARAALAEEE